MIAFIGVGVAMVLVCLAFVLVPMWRAGRASGDRRREANIEVYRQRRDEIDRELAAERVTPASAEAEKEELGARLLADIDATTALADSERPARAPKPWLATVVVIVVVGAGGAGAYGWLGDWQAIENRDMPNFDQMMARLSADVNAHPNQRGARLMLAQIQQSAGRYAAAAHNLHIINQSATSPNPRLLIAEAESTIAAQNGLSKHVGKLFAKALSVDPDNPTALWYLGLQASEAGQPNKALRYWHRLLQQDLPAKTRAMVISRRNALAGDKPKL